MKVSVVWFTGGSKLGRLPFAAIVSILMFFSATVFAQTVQGKFNSSQYEKALEFWQGELNKNKNSPEANYNLAMLFDNGVDTNQSIAKKHYLMAAKKDYAPAMFKLGVIMAKDNDYSAAIKWWLKASNSDIPEAQYNLAKLYRDGIGVEKDLYKAKYWFKKAAESALEKYHSISMDVENTN